MNIQTLTTCLIVCLLATTTHAQSLYQDALSLSEIIKNEAKGSQNQTSEPPKLVAIKERTGVNYVFTKVNPIDYSGGAFELKSDYMYWITGASEDAQIELTDTEQRAQLYQFQTPDLQFRVIRTLGGGAIGNMRSISQPQTELSYDKTDTRTDATITFSDDLAAHAQIYPLGKVLSSFKSNWKSGTIAQNRLQLSEVGRYFLSDLNTTDTIQLAIHQKQPTRLYFQDENTLVVEHNGQQQTLPYSGILEIVNQYDEVRISGTFDPADEVILDIDFSNISATRLDGRQLFLYPENWHQINAPIYALVDGEEYQMAFRAGEKRLDSLTYVLKGATWNSYIAHVVQGKDTLFADIDAFVDSLQIQYVVKRGELTFNYTATNEETDYESERFYPKPLGNISYVLQQKAAKKYDENNNPILFRDRYDAYEAILAQTSIQVHGFLEIPSEEVAAVRNLDLFDLIEHSGFVPITEDRFSTSKPDVFVPGAAELFSTDYFETPIVSIAKGKAFAFYAHTLAKDKDGNEIDHSNTVVVFVMTDIGGELKTMAAKPDMRLEEGNHFKTYLGMNTFNDFLLFNYMKPFADFQKVVKTRDIQNVPTILGTHNNFLHNQLQSRNLLSNIVFDYKKNPILRTRLNDYLLRNPFGESEENQLIRQQIEERFELYYPWQEVLYEDGQLALEQKVSYQDLVNTYRRPIPTASDNLQQASQELASGQKRLSGGLNAATIAAGLSDFVVERAQEELNINFLDRMRNNILSDSSEFKVLFPSTHSMFEDFQIVHYRTLLEFAKTSFVSDLQDLGLNFPNLFELEKYQKLKDDPSVYNIFLIYDLANKIYEETPVDSVLLHLYDRLDTRQQNLDANLNRSLSQLLISNEKQRQALIAESQDVFESINRFDYELLLKIDSLFWNSTYENRDNIATLSRRLDSSIRTQYGESIGAEYDYNYFLKPESGRGSFDRFRVQMEGLNEEDEQLLFSSNEDDPNVRLKKYEYLVPRFLNGDPFYDYIRATLPYAEFDDYFANPPEETALIESGLELMKQFLEGNQLQLRQRWVDVLSQGIEEMAAREREIAIEKEANRKKYPKPVRNIFLFDQYRQSVMSIINNRIRQLDATNADQAHDIQALQYLQAQLSTESTTNQLFDWAKLQDVALRFDNAYAEALETSELNDAPFPYDFNQHFFSTEVTKMGDLQSSEEMLLSILDKVITQLQSLDQKYPDMEDEVVLDVIIDKVYAEQLAENQSTVEITYWQNIYSPRSGIFNLYALTDEPLLYEDKAYLEELIEAFRIDDKGREDRYFRDLAVRIPELQAELTTIRTQFDTLNQRLELMEAELTPKTYQTLQHARDFSTLTETAIHLFNAFRSGSFEVDSIVRLDTLVQTVRLMQLGQEITYDSVSIVPRNISSGKGVRKWITKQQFEQLMDDPIRRDAFLGLLYQRLKTVNPNINFSPEGIALTSTKLINTIYELDELRANVKYQKLQGKQLNFQDYYPFIRTTVDMLNILLTTPIGATALDQQFTSLQDVPQISDQSLSLFENVFAENYGEAIRNVTNLLTIIWDVDVENAQAEMKAIQAAPLLAQQNASVPTNLKALEKQSKKRIKKNDQLKKAMVVYGTFMANIVAAQTADQVRGAIKAVAVPPGSSSVKRTAKFNVALNSYFGGGAYQETLTAPQVTQNQQSSSVGLAVPVGVTASLGGLGKNGNWSYSLFVPVLDIGAVTAYRIDQQNVGGSGNLPELTFGNLIAPGGYLIVNLPKSPFSISAGAQFGPQARQITVNGLDLNSSAWRYGATFTIDVPVFNFFNR
ncbi:MAG: hypothetical protein AAGI23_15240 [Bacteroidota bacterium]